MSQTDNFESMSNAEVRAQCIKHGLPNVPVTDSSRNVLIKKLRAAASGLPASASKKTSASSSNRRETIHSTKVYPSIEAVKAATASKEELVGAPKSPGRSANRRTIGGLPSSQNRINKLSMTKPIVTTNNSTSAAAPVTVKHSPVRNFVPHKVTAPVERQRVILESDEEEDNIMVAAVRRAEQLSSYKGIGAADPYARSRSSRSASLSKTGVLTTSYVQETVPVAPPPIIDLGEEDDEDEGDEEEGEIVESPVRNVVELAPQKTSYNSYRTNDTTVTQKARQENFVTPNLYSSPAQSSRYTLGADSGITANTSATGASRYTENILKPRSRYTLGGEANTITSRFSTTTQNKPSYYSPSTVRNTGSTGTSTNMRSSMLPPAARPIAGNVRSTANYFAEQSDTDTNNEDENNFEAPYLSSFARTLERMKGEPLSPGGDGELSRRYKRTNKIYESPGRRPKINANNDVSLAQIFNALDQKYNIKQNFALLLILLVVIFLFVLFWK